MGEVARMTGVFDGGEETHEEATARSEKSAGGQARHTGMTTADEVVADRGGRVKETRDCGQPTEEQWRRRWLAGHAPYRPWCPACVAGRGMAEHHRKLEKDRQDEAPVVAMDYAFFSTHGDVAKDEGEGGLVKRGGHPRPMGESRRARRGPHERGDGPMQRNEG